MSHHPAIPRFRIYGQFSRSLRPVCEAVEAVDASVEAVDAVEAAGGISPRSQRVLRDGCPDIYQEYCAEYCGACSNFQRQNPLVIGRLVQGVPSARGPWLVNFDLGVPPSCPAEQSLLPNSNQLRQNWADSGTPKIQVNPTRS